jgi:hypothetical protein
MNKLELRKVEATGTGTLHIKIFLDDKDVGFIYLNNDEIDTVVKCLKRGALASEVELITDVYNDDDEDIEDDN